MAVQPLCRSYWQNAGSARLGLWGDNPIVNVSWHDAIEYANWLSQRMDLQEVYSGDLRSDAVKPNWQAKGYR
ncbi:MAG: SUMF1/EgtB/PvdO family nonheme iron enzyme, partial [Saprospiraceae bacterium]|nr:SUMF1/EgtB/PvdO family nonheme iron enzyme [Saprospiraceae bacterium]